MSAIVPKDDVATKMYSLAIVARFIESSRFTLELAVDDGESRAQVWMDLTDFRALQAVLKMAWAQATNTVDTQPSVCVYCAACQDQDSQPCRPIADKKSAASAVESPNARAEHA